MTDNFSAELKNLIDTIPYENLHKIKEIAGNEMTANEKIAQIIKLVHPSNTLILEELIWLNYDSHISSMYQLLFTSYGIPQYTEGYYMVDEDQNNIMKFQWGKYPQVICLFLDNGPFSLFVRNNKETSHYKTVEEGIVNLKKVFDNLDNKF